MTYFTDYENEPTEDPGNPYWQCIHCGITDPQINGRLDGHLSWCEYRVKKISEGFEDDQTEHE